MSQSGYTPIQLYRTTTAAATPSAGNLAAGELAINLTDEKLYFKNTGGTVKLLASTDTLGTVTSVAASGGTTGLTFSGSPITTSGTLTLGGTLAVANGGTGVTTSTGTGSVVLSNSPTLVTPVLGAASATSIAAALGSAGSPSYTFTGDTNTGIFSPAADTIAFSEGGVESMRIDSAGQVGIGVVPSVGYGKELAISSDPTSGVGTFGSRGLSSGNNILYMANNAKNTGAFTDTYWTTAPASQYVQNQGAHIWYNAASGTAGNAITFTQAMTLNASGNLGINTTSPATTLHARKDSAGGTTYAIYTDNGAAGAGTNVAGIGFTNGNAMKSSITAAVYNNDFLAFNVGGSGTTERMRIDASGNVGIGTSSPSVRLEVAGEAKVGTGGTGALNGVITINGSSNASYGSIIVGQRNSSNTWAIGDTPAAIGSGTGMISYVYGANPWIVYTNNVERFRINSTGGITSSDLADAVGYKGLPQNSQTSSYTLALSDMGKHISITTGGVVIPANGSVAFPIGATIVVFNNSGSTQTISITTDTLRQAGTTNTGTRTLAVYGLATLVKMTSTVWVVTGNVT